MILNKCLILIIFILILVCIYNQNKYYGGGLNKIIVKKKITIATTLPLYIEFGINNIKIKTLKIDNYTLKKNDLILIKNQTDYQENGLYKVLNIINFELIVEKLQNNNIKNTTYLVQNGILNKNTEWNLYIDLYKKYYQSNHYLFKLSNITNNIYEKNFIIKSKYWMDSSENKNIAKPLINNFLFYNTNTNHIFSFNGITINLNSLNNILLKSTIIVTHILSPNIYLVNNDISFLKIYEPNRICFIDGIKKININYNNEFLATNNTFTEIQCKSIFELIYNKPCIIYIEFDYESNNISINKTLQIADKTTSFIYEVNLYSTAINKDNIININNRLNIYNSYINNSYTKNESQNLISYLDGNVIQKELKKDTVFNNNDIKVDFIQKELLMNKKIINIDLLSNENIDLNKINNIVFKINKNQIDETQLENNFIIMLKNQNNFKENGLYKYLNGNIYKQQFDKNMIVNKFFYIKKGVKNIKNYWIINIDNSVNQKNLAYDKILNPIDQINQNNPYISLINKNQKCIIDSEILDETTPCSKWPCDLRSKLGCLLFSGKLPINIYVKSTKNIILLKNLSLSDLSDTTCKNIFSDYKNYLTSKQNIISGEKTDLFDVDEYISKNIYKTNITSLDNIQIKNKTLILLNHQINEKENGIYKVICIKKVQNIDLYNKLLYDFKSLFKKITTNKSEIFQLEDFKNLYPVKTIFELYIYKKITKNNLPKMDDNNKTNNLTITELTNLQEEVWKKITEDMTDKLKISGEKLLLHLKSFIYKLQFEIKIQSKKSYLLLEYIDLVQNKIIIEKLMPNIKFPSYNSIVLYINNGLNKDNFYKIKLHNTLPNSYKFIKVLESQLFKGGLSDWTKKNYPYIPYKIYKDQFCKKMLQEQTTQTINDLDKLNYDGSNFGDRSLDLLYEFLVSLLPDKNDASYMFNTISRFNTPLGFAYALPLTVTCKSQKAFDEFFHYKRGRFWNYFDYVVDQTIDGLHTN